MNMIEHDGLKIRPGSCTIRSVTRYEVWYLDENNKKKLLDDTLLSYGEAYALLATVHAKWKRCTKPPLTPGYAACTRELGHDGPCANHLIAR